MIETLILGLNQSLDLASEALSEGRLDHARQHLNVGRTFGLALAEMGGLDDEEIEEDGGPGTDDPTTCGHPGPYFDLPGQTMCKWCGASRVDGQWVVL